MLCTGRLRLTVRCWWPDILRTYFGMEVSPYPSIARFNQVQLVSAKTTVERTPSMSVNRDLTR